MFRGPCQYSKTWTTHLMAAIQGDVYENSAQDQGPPLTNSADIYSQQGYRSLTIALDVNNKPHHNAGAGWSFTEPHKTTLPCQYIHATK